MPPRISIAGQRFGRLVAICPAESVGRVSFWKVRCDCGTEKSVATASLRHSGTKSCGCIIGEGSINRTHGETDKTPEYMSWQRMKARVKRSEGRIKCCDRWWNSYENFLADLGRRPGPGYTVDRINGLGDYEPSNCRWADRRQQAQNVRTNRMVEFRGQTKCVTEWAREFGLNSRTVFQRLYSCWTVEDALTVGVVYNAVKPKGRKHGETIGGATPEYRAWKQMKGRCCNQDNLNFAEYGARGISVFSDWKDSFEKFLADMGRRPGKNYSLDRIDPNGNYEPTNCRWADSKTQQRNRRDTHWLTFEGQTLSLSEWAEKLGMGVPKIYARLKRGWSVERALHNG